MLTPLDASATGPAPGPTPQARLSPLQPTPMAPQGQAPPPMSSMPTQLPTQLGLPQGGGGQRPTPSTRQIEGAPSPGGDPYSITGGGILGGALTGGFGGDAAPPPPAFMPDSGGPKSISAGLAPLAGAGASGPSASPAAPGAEMPAASITPDVGFRPPTQQGADQQAPMPPAGPPGGLPGGMPTATTTNLGYGSVTPFGPGSDLTGSEITPNGSPDRISLANQYLANYKGQLLPQLQAQARTITGNEAALGRLGSGQLNTSLGNLALAGERDYNNMASNLMTGALGNQIQDYLNQRNELRGERGYQAGQQRTAFDQGVTETGLQDQLTGNAFERAMREAEAGYGGNPASTSLALSGIFGNQAGQASQGLGSMIGGTVANNAAQQNSGIPDWLMAYLAGGNRGGPTPTPDVPGGVDLGGAVPGGLQIPGVQLTPGNGGYYPYGGSDQPDEGVW